eukprot:9881589-Ditylum_brightwellii.AAC.1
MIWDHKAYGHDREVLNALHLANSQVNYHNTPWHQCTAHKLLKEDIASGGDKVMKLSQLCSTREGHMAIELKTFLKWIPGS